MHNPLKLEAPLAGGGTLRLTTVAGGTLRLTVVPPPPVVDTTSEPVEESTDDEPSSVRPGLAKCQAQVLELRRTGS